MKKYRFSVFTATFNRAKFLPMVYESLVKQTFKDFEWIVVDDGSTDNTEELVNSFISEKKIKSIRYFKKTNGGKHTAWRLGTKKFNSTYVVSIDSDDFLTENSLEIFNKHWKDLETSNYYNEFWEVKARARYLNGEIIEKPLPKSVLDMNAIELSYKYRITGDLHGCRKTCVLKNEAKVPDYFMFEEKCSNFTESIRWFRAGKKYKTRYVEEITEVVNLDAGNRLTGNRRNDRNEKLIYNSIVGVKFHLEENRSYMFRWWKVLYFKSIALLLYNSFRVKENPFKILETNFVFDKIILIGFYLPMYFLFLIRG